MVDSKDVFLGLAGFILSLYGGVSEDLTKVVSGVIILILMIVLNLYDQESHIQKLKAQINTKSELDHIWRQLDEIQKRERR